MKLFDIARSAVDNLQESLDLRLAQKRADKATITAGVDMMNEVREDWRKVNEADSGNTTGLVNETPLDGGWQNTTWAEKGHVFGDQLQMIMSARKFYRYDANARAALMGMVKYIIGEEVKIRPKSKDPRIHYIWHEFWNAPRNKMALRQFEIVMRFFRDGEVFLQYFNKDDKGAGTWKSTVRFRDPVFCRAPIGEQFMKQQTSNGVEVDVEDVETPVQYWFVNPYNQTAFTAIPAKEMQHMKLMVDSDQKRGETFYQPVMRLLTQYRNWLENRMILNKIRTAIVLIRKVTKGTQADVTRLSSTLGQSPTSRSMDTKSRGIMPGTILNANDGVDYKMESPNINAQDAAEDGRTVVTRIAAGCGVPEYMMGDASNANYASSMVSESPFVKEVKFWQKIFRYHFAEMFRRVIQAAVDAGKIEAPPEDDDILDKLAGEMKLKEADDMDPKDDPDETGNKRTATEADVASKSYETPNELFYGCDVEFPDIVHRNLKEVADALTMARNNGWVSDGTAAALFGLDYAAEVRKQRDMLDQANKEGNPLLGLEIGDEDAQAEMETGDNQNAAIIRAILADLSADDKAKLLGSRTFIDFLNMMMGKNVTTPDPAGGTILDDKGKPGAGAPPKPAVKDPADAGK